MVTRSRCSAPGASLITLLLLVSACGPASAVSERAQAPQPRAPKVLTWAAQREPSDFLAASGLGSTGAPTAQFRKIAQDSLLVRDNNGTPHPQLAVELPSVEKGTWRVNADGTGETIWKLHPKVLWHDGTPFTSEDLLFYFTVFTDPAFPLGGRIPGSELMASAAAPDPTTFVIHWSRPYYKADETPAFAPLPRHLLEVVYQQKDIESFVNHPYFRMDFVGVGPYRLVRWEQGSHMEFVRFDEYYLGRPPLDQVILRFIPDFSTMLTNSLAGAVDIAQPIGDLEPLLDIERRWEGTGNRLQTDSGDSLRFLEIQHRQEHARPRNGPSNRTVREALYHATDRQALSEVSTLGHAPIADSWLHPMDRWRKDLEPSIPQFPYEPGRAQQLLAQAGWLRGSDGILAHQESGDRFETEIWSRPAAGSERELELIASMWRAVGVAGRTFAVSTARLTDREYMATQPGVLITNPAAEDLYNGARHHSRNISAPANRWAGRNLGGYNSPAADVLMDRLVTTIRPAEQIALHRQLLQEMMADIPIIPLYWEAKAALVLKSVKGTVTGSETGWNIFTWDKEA